MGRMIKEIEIEGKPVIALFDTGAIHTYLRTELLLNVAKRVITKPYKVILGGREIEVKELCIALG